MELVLFDLDNTLLTGDSDYEWGRFLIEQGVFDRDTYEAANNAFYDQYKAGTLDIHEFLAFQLAPLARYPRQQLEAWHAAFMDSKVRPMITLKARQLVAEHLRRFCLCAIVTATNSFITWPIAREFDISHLIATEPEERDGRFTGGVDGVPCFREGKLVRVEGWMEKQALDFTSFSDSWFYGDSLNDLFLLERVTRPVAVDPDKTLREEAERRGWEIISLR